MSAKEDIMPDLLAIPSAFIAGWTKQESTMRLAEECGESASQKFGIGIAMMPGPGMRFAAGFESARKKIACGHSDDGQDITCHSPLTTPKQHFVDNELPVEIAGRNMIIRYAKKIRGTQYEVATAEIGGYDAAIIFGEDKCCRWLAETALGNAKKVFAGGTGQEWESVRKMILGIAKKSQEPLLHFFSTKDEFMSIIEKEMRICVLAPDLGHGTDRAKK